MTVGTTAARIGITGTGTVMLAATLVAGCGGPSKQQKAAYAEAASHYVPPAVTSRLDFGGIVERRFRRLDRNSDDYITPDELPRQSDPAIMSLDQNGDGRVSAQEFSEGMMKRFDANDLNKDGTVTSNEHHIAKERAAGH
ncbi:MAG: hypothetical protein ACRYFW_13135 [Janthinobacterium lividum]